MRRSASSLSLFLLIRAVQHKYLMFHETMISMPYDAVLLGVNTRFLPKWFLVCYVVETLEYYRPTEFPRSLCGLSRVQGRVMSLAS